VSHRPALTRLVQLQTARCQEVWEDHPDPIREGETEASYVSASLRCYVGRGGGRVS
jgi:hypothetical protein